MHETAGLHICIGASCSMFRTFCHFATEYRNYVNLTTTYTSVHGINTHFTLPISKNIISYATFCDLKQAWWCYPGHWKIVTLKGGGLGMQHFWTRFARTQKTSVPFRRQYNTFIFLIACVLPRKGSSIILFTRQWCKMANVTCQLGCRQLVIAL